MFEKGEFRANSTPGDESFGRLLRQVLVQVLERMAADYARDILQSDIIELVARHIRFGDCLPNVEICNRKTFAGSGVQILFVTGCRFCYLA